MQILLIHPCKKFFILVSQTCERNHLVCFTKGLMQTQHISSLMVKKNSMIINKSITSWFSFAFAMIYQWAIIIRVCNWTGYTQFQDRPTWKTGSGTSSCWHWSGNRFPKFGNGLNRSGNRFQVITHPETSSWIGFGTSSQTNFVSRSPKPFFFSWFLFLLPQSHDVFSLGSLKHTRHSSFVIPLPHLLTSLSGSLSHRPMDERCSLLPNSCVSHELARLISLL